MKKSITINVIIVSIFALAIVASYYISQYWPPIVRN
jgi:hypothetical protein